MQQKTYTRKQYLQLFDDFFDHYNSLSKKNNVKSFWPITRIQACYFLFLYLDNKVDKKKISNVLIYKKLKVTFSELISFFKLCIKLILLRFKLENILKHKVLLFGFSEHYYTYNNEKVNLYLSPLKLELKKSNILFDEFLISNTNTSTPPSSVGYLYQVIYKYNKLFFRIKNILFSSSNKTAFQNASYLNNFLEGKSIENSKHIASLIYSTQLEQEIRYNTYKLLFKITKPKVIWTYCFYDNSVMAMIRACNHLNIPTIEYQHSAQSDVHHAYAKWKHANLYSEFFPKFFWVWSEVDGERIMSNFGCDDYVPEVIVGGNLSIVQGKETLNENTSKSKNGILVSLQGNWIPKFVEDVIANDNKYVWYFRLHPRYPNDKEKLLNFKAQFPNKIEIEIANSSSLIEVFSMVHCNVTDFSGVALEAEEFGIKNIIIGDKGFNTFQDKINSQFFSFTQCAVEFLKNIETVVENVGVDTNYVKRQKIHALILKYFK